MRRLWSDRSSRRVRTLVTQLARSRLVRESGRMRADIHDGPEQTLQSEAGYSNARPHQPGRRNLLHRTAGPYSWVNRPAGPLPLPPLLAATHSSLLQVPEFRERLHRSARCLLAAGADPTQRIVHRWPPASLREPDDNHPLSALYGAAGVNRDPELTKLLLEAGADPNDGESL